MTNINFATATPEELAAAGYSFKVCRAQKGPKKSSWVRKGSEINPQFSVGEAVVGQVSGS